MKEDAVLVNDWHPVTPLEDLVDCGVLGLQLLDNAPSSRPNLWTGPADCRIAAARAFIPRFAGRAAPAFGPHGDRLS